MAARPVAVPTASASRSSPSHGPSSVTNSSSEGPATYSLTRKAWPPSKPAPRIRAAQNGATRHAAFASAVNLSLAALSEVQSPSSSVMVTSLPSTVLARYTGPATGIPATRPVSLYRPTFLGSSACSGVPWGRTRLPAALQPDTLSRSYPTPFVPPSATDRGSYRQGL